MGWTLAPNVHFCTTSERVVFLDTARDRYFALPDAQSAAFRAWIDAEKAAPAPPVAKLLIDAHLLEVQDAAGSPCPPAIAPAVRALGELGTRPTVRDQLEVGYRVLRVRQALRRNGLLATLEQLRPTRCEHVTDETRHQAAVFMRARRRIPLSDNCLHDSLAMIAWLNRRGASASIVFGVTGVPFRAHCWVQLGDQVLNDALDHVAPFTPILQR